MIDITVSDDLEGQLRRVANEFGGSIDNLVEEALRHYLIEMEQDRQDIASARLALEEYEKEGGGITLNELASELGILE